MADAKTWFPIVRDAYASIMGLVGGMTLEQRFKGKDPALIKALGDLSSRAIEATVKKLVDEDMKIWRETHRPPEDVIDRADRAWKEMSAQQKDAYFQNLLKRLER